MSQTTLIVLLVVGYLVLSKSSSNPLADAFNSVEKGFEDYSNNSETSTS